MKKSILSTGFLVALLMFCFVLPSNAKMDMPNEIQESSLKQLEKPTTLKDRIAKKALTKRVKKMQKKSKIFKNNASNDDLIRWILIGVAILVAVALIRVLGGVLGNVLGLVLLILVLVLLLNVLGII